MEKYKNDMPLHIAMIMDGNGRWAKKRMMPRTYGHKEGCENLKRISMACNDLGIKYLTVYAFSTENWKRSASEVATLMDLFNKYLEEASSQFIENNIKIKVIGDKSKLSPNLQKLIARTETITSSHTGLHLQVAFNYGGRDEIIRAIEKIMTDVSKSEEIKVTEELFSTYLDTAGVPEPDLLIRTGGEKRLSNYLLWELAYSELYFSNTLWPDFTKEELVKIIEMY
ncbi:MAG: undecaprenyl diphosphate synthase [Clostridiales bacterium]|nr:undecaprenyl diphosphate synthase [Clostridiales bacterium]